MATYSTDADLLKYRSDILSFNVDSWSDQHDEAYSIINRIIQARWYRDAAVKMGYDPNLTLFDPTLIKTGTLTRLEAFKTLELAFMVLKKNAPEEDGFERFEKSFRDRYNEELAIILDVGIDYDWSGSGTFDDDELYIRSPRRQKRV